MRTRDCRLFLDPSARFTSVHDREFSGAGETGPAALPRLGHSVAEAASEPNTFIPIGVAVNNVVRKLEPTRNCRVRNR